MKIGIFTALFHDRPIEEALDYIAGAGIQAVEFGGGAYPGARHLEDLGGVAGADRGRGQAQTVAADARQPGSGADGHLGPRQPHPPQQRPSRKSITRRSAMRFCWRKNWASAWSTVSAAARPGRAARIPNWVTCPWPDEFRDILEYQWNEVAIPYWKEQDAFLKQHNVKFAIEAHPGFVVYNPETVIKLRQAAGDNIGCNFDPSHFWWQGIDPLAAVRYLLKEGAVFHVHAKDTRIDTTNSGINGNLDVKSYGAIAERSWVFRSVGYGHPQAWWNDFVTTLRMGGYDWVLSIEHEDGMMSNKEGLTKALQTLEIAVVKEKPGAMFWAKE